jgi:hypothetical protein
MKWLHHCCNGTPEEAHFVSFSTRMQAHLRAYRLLLLWWKPITGKQ